MTDENKEIFAVSKLVGGRMHDKKLYDKTRAIPPPDSEKIGDSGYQGTKMTTPYKRKKGKKLTVEQKKFNQELASKRAGNEHAIARIKTLKIMAEKHRNPRNKFNLKIKNIAGLANINL